MRLHCATTKHFFQNPHTGISCSKAAAGGTLRGETQCAALQVVCGGEQKHCSDPRPFQWQTNHCHDRRCQTLRGSWQSNIFQDHNERLTSTGLPGSGPAPQRLLPASPQGAAGARRWRMPPHTPCSSAGCTCGPATDGQCDVKRLCLLIPRQARNDSRVNSLRYAHASHKNSIAAFCLLRQA